jgi:hypothetical protein
VTNNDCGSGQSLLSNATYNPTGSACDCQSNWSNPISATLITSQTYSLIETGNPAHGFPCTSVAQAKTTCYMKAMCAGIIYRVEFLDNRDYCFLLVTHDDSTVWGSSLGFTSLVDNISSPPINSVSGGTAYLLDRYSTSSSHCYLPGLNRTVVDPRFGFSTYQSLVPCPYTYPGGSCCYREKEETEYINHPTCQEASYRVCHYDTPYICTNPHPSISNLTYEFLYPQGETYYYIAIYLEWFNNYGVQLHLKPNFACNIGPVTFQQNNQCSGQNLTPLFLHLHLHQPFPKISAIDQ